VSGEGADGADDTPDTAAETGDAGPQESGPAAGGDGDPSVIDRIIDASASERLLLSLAALVLAMLVGTVIILMGGRMTTCSASQAAYYFGVGFCYDPVAVYAQLFLGALGNPLSAGWSPLNPQVAVTLRETTILVFTGLSVAIAFRAGIFNIGTQGQLVVGGLATGLATLWVASIIPIGGLAATVVLVAVGLSAGALGGGFYGAIPGALKAYADANEVITTIMLNFIATSVTFFLVSEYFREEGSQAIQTARLPEVAAIPTLLFLPRNNFSIYALVIGVVLMGAIAYLLAGTSFGYDIRTSGLQPEAAEYGGVDAERTVVASMALSGALGGLGGALYVLMILGRFQVGVPAYGFDGITVAILAGNNPLGVGFAALLFGALKSGSTVVQTTTNVPPQLVGVLRGLIILFVAMPEFFRMLARVSVGRGRDDQSGAVATDGGRVVSAAADRPADDAGAERGGDRDE
jgi:simple sugar transport system permease protein